MQVGSGNGITTVGISGAPAWLYTGAAVQLSALVVPERRRDLAGGDIVGGNPRSARSTRRASTGPRDGPGDGKVRITATSDDGAFDAVEITIVAPARRRPSPTCRIPLPDPDARPTRPPR